MHPHTCKHAVANKDLIKSVTHTYTQKEPTLIQIHEDTCMYNTPQSPEHPSSNPVLVTFYSFKLLPLKYNFKTGKELPKKI